MWKKWLMGLALAGLVLLPVTATAQNEKTPPALVMRVQSFDAVVQNVKVLAKAVGKEEMGNQIEGLIKAQAGPKGLDGIDTKKPMGIYVTMGDDLTSISGVLMIPIKDEAAFLKVLENFNYKAVKNKAGVYVIEQNEIPLEIGFRFANGYAYVTGLNLEAIAPANLVPPAQIFPANVKALASGVLRVDQIPKFAKDIALTKLDEAISNLKDKVENEAKTPAQKKLAKQALDTIGEQVANFIRGATDVAGQLDIDAKNKQITFEMTIDGKKNSQVKAAIVELGKQKDLFGGLMKKGAEANQQVHIVLPNDLKKAFNEFINETIAKALDAEPDAKKKEFAKKFFYALLPTLHSGELHSGSMLQTNADGTLTVVGGVKVQQGGQIEQTLQDLHKQLPPGEQAKFKLNVDKAGAANIHQVNIQHGFGPKEKKLFGDNPLYFSVGPNTVFIAVGKDGLAALKTAATAPAVPGNKVAYYELNLGKIFEFALNSEKERALAKKIFAKDPGMVKFIVEGGQVLHIQGNISISVLEFGVALKLKTSEVRLQNNKGTAITSLSK